MAPDIVTVALDTPLDRLFDYRLPAAAATAVMGSLLEVPFGRKFLVGVATGFPDATPIADEKLREVVRVFDDRPALPMAILDLAKFCADYYHYPLGPVLLSALPPRLRNAKPVLIVAPWLSLTEAGAVAMPSARARAQHSLLSELRIHRCIDRATLRERRQMRHASALIEAGWAVWRTQPASSPAPEPASNEPCATADQQAVLAQLLPALDRFGVHLLHGATGSGKTEVYLRLIEAMHTRQRQTLLLIPEIALTPQLENIFRARFPASRIALLHSGLADHARVQNWLAAADCDLLLGTRSSVFTPLPRLGLIVVDEEHDLSYKQQDGLRYSARDMAIARAKQADLPIVLGSATPALETYQQAISGRYALLTMAARAVENARLPAIELVDLRHAAVENGLTRPVLGALSDHAARGEQSLVFLNRRGYSPTLYCPGCAWVAPCPRCSARLVLHRSSRKLKCHHCGHESPVPKACPDCGDPNLTPLGQGTQRLEETLTAALPDVRIRRIDRDTMRPRAWAELGDAMRAGHTDILLGTQMLAKGHDFPNMTLVVILDCDGALYSPDFRATERLFAQLMQVAGRAGRADKPGRVLVQTAFPDHPLFRHLLRHDYTGFADAVLAERKKLELPPFTRQALLRAEAPQMAAALAFLHSARAAIPATARVSVFDPMPAPMARVAGLERAQLLVQSPQRTALHAFLAQWRTTLAAIKPRVARWSLDVDPLDF
jgi:primosomal protein N' (replication factor Y)